MIRANVPDRIFLIARVGEEMRTYTGAALSSEETGMADSHDDNLAATADGEAADALESLRSVIRRAPPLRPRRNRTARIIPLLLIAATFSILVIAWVIAAKAHGQVHNRTVVVMTAGQSIIDASGNRHHYVC